jgi:hypothetical protein
MTKTPSELWLTVADVCQRLGVTPGKVHRLVEERALLGTKRDGVFQIPEAFLDGDQPLANLWLGQVKHQVVGSQFPDQVVIQMDGDSRMKWIRLFSNFV